MADDDAGQQEQQMDDDGNDDNNNNNYNGNDDDTMVCKIYDNHDFFTIAVQMVLAFIALLSLYIKRMNEHPKRLFWTWFADVSKQGIGAGYAHVMNMVIAAVIAGNIDEAAEYQLQDECAWYGMSFLLDTTLGLFLAILLLGALDRLAHLYAWESLQNSGVYTGRTALRDWIHQVFAWMLILTVVKLILYFVLWTFNSVLAWMGGIIFKPFQANTRFELIFVMILFPGFMNVIYFWIADGYLKAKDDQDAAHLPEEWHYGHPEQAEAHAQKKETLLTDEEKQQATAKTERPSSPSWANPGGDNNYGSTRLSGTTQTEVI